MINKNAAVSKHNVKYEINLTTKPTPPWSNEVPLNILVIHTGRTLSINNAASPNVQTTIRDDVRFSINSSRYVIYIYVNAKMLKLRY